MFAQLNQDISLKNENPLNRNSFLFNLIKIVNRYTHTRMPRYHLHMNSRKPVEKARELFRFRRILILIKREHSHLQIHFMRQKSLFNFFTFLFFFIFSTTTHTGKLVTKKIPLLSLAGNDVGVCVCVRKISWTHPMCDNWIVGHWPVCLKSPKNG